MQIVEQPIEAVGEGLQLFLVAEHGEQFIGLTHLNVEGTMSRLPHTAGDDAIGVMEPMGDTRHAAHCSA